MRNYVNQYIHLSMSKQDIKVAISPFIDSTLPESEIKRIEEDVTNWVNDFNKYTSGTVEEEVWSRYLEHKDDDSRYSAAVVKEMVRNGMDYRKKLESGYYDQKDREHWDKAPVYEFDLQYLAFYELDKAGGRGHLRITEDYEDDQKNKQKRGPRPESGAGARSASHQDDSISVRFLKKIHYDNPHENLIFNDDSQWKIIKGLYRKKARELHPDKNPDRQEATAEFPELEHDRDRFKSIYFPDLSTDMTSSSGRYGGSRGSGLG